MSFENALSVDGYGCAPPEKGERCGPAPHAIALFSDDPPRVMALYRLITQHEEFLHQLSTLASWYVPAVQSALGVAVSDLTVTPLHRTRKTATLARRDAQDAQQALPDVVLDVDELGLSGLSPVVQVSVVFHALVPVMAASERLLDNWLAAFVITEPANNDEAPQIHRSPRADTAENLHRGNIALAVHIFVEALTDYFSSAFEAFARGAHRAEEMLKVLMQDERVAQKVNSVHAGLKDDAVGGVELKDLLLAPLHMLRRYQVLLQGMLDAISVSDFRERRRVESDVALIKPRLAEMGKLIHESAAFTELRKLDKFVRGCPIPLAVPGRRVMMRGDAVQVSHKIPVKWHERCVILCNDVLMWCKRHDGDVLGYTHHLDLSDALIYEKKDGNGQVIPLQNNLLIQLVNKREKKLRIFSLQFPTALARRRWFSSISERINSYFAIVLDQYHMEQEHKAAAEARQKALAQKAHMRAARQQATSAAERQWATLMAAASTHRAMSKEVTGRVEKQLDKIGESLRSMESEAKEMKELSASLDLQMEELTASVEKSQMKSLTDAPKIQKIEL